MTYSRPTTSTHAPRPFQQSARKLLHTVFAAGHCCQMVMSPTGSGKTILAMFLINESLARGKRIIVVADRRTLINQTSEVADSLGLSHGVLMADSLRFDPTAQFQIASAQTLAMRDWPDADIIIIDEAHTQMKVWTDHIHTCRAAVIGLSATPFSAVLGKCSPTGQRHHGRTDRVGRAGADALYVLHQGQHKGRRDRRRRMNRPGRLPSAAWKSSATWCTSEYMNDAAFIALPTARDCAGRRIATLLPRLT